MLAGHNIRHITIHMLRDDLPKASLALAELEAFAPDDRPLLEQELPEIPGQAFRERTHRTMANFDKVKNAANWCAPSNTVLTATVEREQLEQLDDWLAEAWKELGAIETEQHALKERRREIRSQEKSLRELSALEINFSQLHNNYSHLDISIGSMPIHNLPRLNEAFKVSGHIILQSHQDNDQVHLVIAGAIANQSTLKSVLASAGFQRLDIPEAFQGSQEQVLEDLTRQLQNLDTQEAQLQQHLSDWTEQHHTKLLAAQSLLDAASPYVSLEAAARTKGAVGAIQGWLPKNKLSQMQELLSQHLPNAFVVEERAPRKNEFHLVPVMPTTSRSLQPFSILVRQYGVPRFGEFDPTGLFAITFAAMFGMMFGDIGHGMAFVLFALLMRKKLQSFTRLFLVAGLSATLFGFLYGSIFGVEHWIEPLWIAPMSDPIYMLTAAMIWGIAFLTMGSLIAISNRLLAGDHLGALFDPGGVFALALYLALITGLIGMINGDGFGIIPTAIILLSLTLLLVYQWRETEAPFGERLLIVVIETFELVNGYVTSSLSFLRVAAFSINHVALSLAVFTLADMQDGAEHWITIVLGNVFVIILEGFIVAIQTLRLEYYEGFSRFYYGDGLAFKPLKIGR